MKNLVKLYPTGTLDPTIFYCQMLDITVKFEELNGNLDISKLSVISGGMWTIFTIKVGVYDIENARIAGKFIFSDIESHIPQIKCNNADRDPETKSITSISNEKGPKWVYVANMFREEQGSKCVAYFRDGSRSSKRSPYIVLDSHLNSVDNVDLLMFCTLLLAKQLKKRKQSSQKYKYLVKKYGRFSNDN
ncbi:hypothetical protein E3Q08_02706 [Wallemia mellicola]|uniref:Uncharacterized protein n=1 Tax=Wallemia mellicola TaxID=1708541 RepID=A0AB38MT76_9BASI|nr:hypothetical protein E3Q16_04041 [Wallemia mellicola]TIC42518.1 hypothetical protein E3Q08_02706 [Wallemia mellicola]TIC64545.1 hypothetical protein E3Q02_02549 [Wallemia mellicola]